MSQPQLNLLVIRSTDIHRAVSFYQRLGIEFSLHAHGTGPEHYASLSTQYLLEIYPDTGGNNHGSKVRLGFLVDNLDALIESLRNDGIKIFSEPRNTEWGRRAVARDFDGNTVELIDSTVTPISRRQTVWVFNGSNSSFPSGIFTTRELAEAWIESHHLNGTLTEYPVDISAYDHAIEKNWFTPKSDGHQQPLFIQRFTSASQDHYHYEHGKCDSKCARDD